MSRRVRAACRRARGPCLVARDSCRGHLAGVFQSCRGRPARVFPAPYPPDCTGTGLSRADGSYAARPDAEIDISDIVELDQDFFRHAEVRMPKAKQMVSLRLDSDVLHWFKNQGKGYQTRVNAVLRAYVEAHKR